MPSPDPFFHIPPNTEWNACIGRQGEEANYAEGYIEAAIELATAVIGKELYNKRDTLVLPILYNARHAIELHLKLVIGEFVRVSVFNAGHPKNHDIQSHLEWLKSKDIPDKEFKDCLSKLAPYVASLAQIDDDGQELRYHENRDGQRSMDGQALANIALILVSLKELHKVLEDLRYRAYSLCDEWPTGTRTRHCSRRDLVDIAKMLPSRDNWISEEFDDCRSAIKARFNLGSKQFSLALDIIQNTRGLAYLVGIESNLVHLSDQKAEFLVEQWNIMHPPRKAKDDLGHDFISDRDFKEIFEGREARTKATKTIMDTISPDEFADAATLFSLARDNSFPEHYEKRLERKKSEIRVRNDYRVDVHDLMSKTSFPQFFITGLRSVGRIDLANRLGNTENTSLTEGNTDNPEA